MMERGSKSDSDPRREGLEGRVYSRIEILLIEGTAVVIAIESGRREGEGPSFSGENRILRLL